MKQKLVIGLALVLLLVMIGNILFDFFYSGSDRRPNPFDYGMNDLREDDPALVKYHESFNFVPELAEIHCISVDVNDRIFVAGANGVEVFTREGNKESGFPFPDTAYCMAVSPGGNMFFGMGDHIEVMDPEGMIIRRWRPESDRSVLTSVATNGSDIFVADAGERTVYRYDSNGNLLIRIAQEDSLLGIPRLVIPSPYFDVGIGRDNELWVVNPGRHLFESFRADGTLISTWGKFSLDVEGFSGCCNPSNFAVTPEGSFVTSEKGIERVKLYGPDGVFQCLIAGAGQFNEGTRGLDLAVDSEGRILVLDPLRKKIRIFVNNEK